MGDRFHKAARDGYLEVLKEATRKDLNVKDEDGLSPTLWAAFEGNLDALRLIVGRGGDPDKSDHYGNTALHFAAAKGHLPCVSFLVNFGVNLWALDIDFHTAKDLAAINSREEILRLLDAVQGKEEARDGKKVKALKEKGMREAERRAKEYEKLQKKANKMMEEGNKRLKAQRKEMEVQGEPHHPPPSSSSFLSLRKDSRLLYTNSPKFSEIVAAQRKKEEGPKTILAHYTGVYKKVVQSKKSGGGGGARSTGGGGGGTGGALGDFKVGEFESDGKRSVRSLSGLRRDSEIMYVPKYDNRRGKIDGLFEDESYGGGGGGGSDPPTQRTVRAGSISGVGISRSISQPDYMNQVGSEAPSIFERPGFGSVAFRNSITSAALTRHTQLSDDDEGGGRVGGGEEEELDLGAVELFLAAAGLSNYIPLFIKEKIDLEALMLLDEGDLVALAIPLGPRRKLLKAVGERREALQDPGDLVDSRL